MSRVHAGVEMHVSGVDGVWEQGMESNENISEEEVYF